MANIIITTNTTLDGVVQDPDGLEKFSRGGWFREFGGNLDAWSAHFADEAMRATALLLGKRSAEWFGTRWLTRTGAWADRLNAMPKYIVSSTLDREVWGKATILRDVDAVAALKPKLEGDVLIYASYKLGRALLDRDLVDELRLVTFPVVLGAGERLFGETRKAKPLQHVASKSLGAVVVHTYR